MVAEKDPFESVTPWLTLSEPSLAVIVIGSSAIGLPDASRATTNAIHGPLGAEAVVGTASNANEPTDTSWSATIELVPPPGGALATATETEGPVARMEVGTIAVNSIEETNVVGVELPLSKICEVATKLLPATVMRVAGEPIARTGGETDETEGVGLFTVKLTELDCPPPGAGLVTTTGKFPAVAWSLALSWMVNSVELVNVAA